MQSAIKYLMALTILVAAFLRLEAKKWDNRNFDFSAIGVFQPSYAPNLPPHINELMARVDSLDKNEIRLKLKPDKRIGFSNGNSSMSMGQKALSLIKKLLKI